MVNNSGLIMGNAERLKTIDVIIPAYNAEKFIERTLQSVVSQTYPPEKIIIVNDGSTDKTVEIVEEFIKKESIPIVLVSQINKGPNCARNAGLTHSDSEFVAFVDADDFWEKKKLEFQIELFSKTDNEKLGVIYSEYLLVNELGKEIKKKIGFPFIRGNVFDSLLRGNVIIGSCSSVLVRRECFDQAGLFDESLSGSEDWDMWLRISKEYDFDFSEGSVVFITDRDKSNNKDYESMIVNRIRFLNKWIDEIKKNRELITLHRNKLIMLSIRCKMKNCSFNITENIEKNSSDAVKKEFFGNKKFRVVKFILPAIFNYFIERFF